MAVRNPDQQHTRTFVGGTGTLYVRGLSKLIRDKFHAACLMRGRTMKGVLEEFMRDYARQAETVQRHKRKKK